MEPIAISWLALASFVPLVVFLLVASILTCRSYRDRWISLDLLLVGSACVELIAVLIIFSYAVVRFLDFNLYSYICSLYIWSLMTARLLQLAILSSMTLYRSLYLNSKSRVRIFNVNRGQTRYHLIMLSAVAMSLSAAAVFSRRPPSPLPSSPPQSSITPSSTSTSSPSPSISDIEEGSCSVMRPSWSVTFTMFLFVVLISFIVVHLICSVCGCIVRAYGRHWNHSRADSRSASEYARRYSVVPVMVVTCYAVHHLPYLLISAFASFVIPISSPWLENGLCWFAVAEAFLFPFVLGLADKPHSTALFGTICSRRWCRGSFDESSDGCHYLDELSEAKIAPRKIMANNFAPVDRTIYSPQFPPKANCDDRPTIWPNRFSRRNVFCGGDGVATQNPRTRSPMFDVCSKIIRPHLDTHSLASDDRYSCIGSSVDASDDFEFHDGRQTSLVRNIDDCACNLKPAESWTERERQKDVARRKNDSRLALITLSMSLSMNDLDKVNSRACSPLRMCEIYLTDTLTRAVSDTGLNQTGVSQRLQTPRFKDVEAPKCEQPVPLTDVVYITPKGSRDFRKVIVTRYL